MADCQEFCLRWNNFQSNITHQFETLRDDEDFVDVTLTCGGKCIKAHKVVLSACSPYFKELLKNNPCKHPIIFMRDVEFSHLKALVAFMYAGVVNVAQAQLASFLRTAEALHILGLTEGPQLHRDLKNFPLASNSRTGGAQANAASTDSPAGNASASGSPRHKDENEENASGSPSRSPSSAIARRSKTSSSGTTEQREHESGSGPGWSGSGDGDGDGEGDAGADGDGDGGEAPPGSTVPASALFQQSRGSLVITPAEPADSDMDQSYNDDLVDMLEPKTELPDYSSDGESRTDAASYLDNAGDVHGFGTMNDLMSATSSQGTAGQDGQPMESYQAALRKLHSLDPRPCPICQRMYSNLSNLRQHMRLIHIPQSVECPLCSRSFKTKLYLRRHLLSYHDIPVKWESSNSNPHIAGLAANRSGQGVQSGQNVQSLQSVPAAGANWPSASPNAMLNTNPVIPASVSATSTQSSSVNASSASAMPPPHSYLNVEEELKRTYIQSPHRVRSSCGGVPVPIPIPVPVVSDSRLHQETDNGLNSSQQAATPSLSSISLPSMPTSGTVLSSTSAAKEESFPSMASPFLSGGVGVGGSPVLHVQPKSENVPDYMRSTRFSGLGQGESGQPPQQQMGQFGSRVGYSNVNVPFSET